MPRLIDANKFITDNKPMLSSLLMRRINDAPTVDAVEVVRCKDCMKYIPCQNLPIGTSKWCDLFDRATCEMNYCAWGERREDADL